MLQALEQEAHRADTMGGELGEVKSISVTFSESGTSRRRADFAVFAACVRVCVCACVPWSVGFEQYDFT